MAGEQLSPDTEIRGYAWLAGELRERIQAGDIAAGRSLPTTRELGAEHGISRETARRAIKELEAEGLVVSEPRHGYRVQALANDPGRGLPVAFVVSAPEETGGWDDFHRQLFAGLQQAGAERGWPLLAIGATGRSARSVMEQLGDCRAGGMILDSMNPELLAAVRKMGLPTVMMDAWQPEMALDAVVQDSFQGGMLAVKHLADRGHDRIGWLGWTTQSVQGLERFGGVCAGLTAAGIEIRNELMPDTRWGEIATAAREMLRKSDRPTGMLGLWLGAAVELVRAAAELGLKRGKDIEIIGWSAEEQYDGAYRAAFGGEELPATIVWSIAELARLTVARLAQRRSNPKFAPALLKVPTKLRLSERDC